MSTIGLDQFRTMLQRLLQRTQQHRVEWFHDEEEDTLVVEFESGTDISVYYRQDPQKKDLAGAILKLDNRIAATLEAEHGDEEDWALLQALFDQAQSEVDGSDEDEAEVIEQALESGQRVGRSAPSESGAVPFDPLSRDNKISLEDLTEEDSGFAAEREE